MGVKVIKDPLSSRFIYFMVYEIKKLKHPLLLFFNISLYNQKYGSVYGFNTYIRNNTSKTF